LYGRPQVLVVGPRTSAPGFENLAEAFARAAQRAYDPTGPSYPPAAVVIVRTASDEPLTTRLRDMFGRSGIKVFGRSGPTDLETAIASAVETVAEHPARMYDLDLRTALTMLNSLALAFHSSYFHRDEVGRDAGEHQLFDLGADPSDGPQGIARATFIHVR